MKPSTIHPLIREPCSNDAHFQLGGNRGRMKPTKKKHVKFIWSRVARFAFEIASATS